MFRKDFLAQKKNEWLGDVHVSGPVSYNIIGIYSLVLFITIVLFLFLGSYTESEKAQGNVLPDKGLIHINSNEDGFISEIFVSNGEHIKKGMPLFSVSKEKNTEQYGETHYHINNQLNKRKELLTKELEEKKHYLTVQKKIKSDHIASLRQEQEEIKQQISITRQQSLRIKSTLSDMVALKDKGYVSGLEIQSQENLFLENEKQLKSLQRQLIDNTMRLNEQEDAISRLIHEYSTEENRINNEIYETEKNIVLNKSDEKNIYSAKEDGFVSSLLFEKGQSVRPGDIIMSLIPDDSKFIIQLFISGNAIGFIKPGNDVTLRFRAYPYQKFGVQHGKVDEISMNIISARQLTDITGNPSSSPYYRITVVPDNQFIYAYGDKKPLIAGMVVDADIMIDKRNIFEWIFEPFFGLKNRYMQ
ncbi:TPA: HlyD family efflux transporter periplasmic adaptor subunit [Salmonella enterica subsp. enterica serovar Reading]